LPPISAPSEPGPAGMLGLWCPTLMERHNAVLFYR
jgi:hypothetical protein